MMEELEHYLINLIKKRYGDTGKYADAAAIHPGTLERMLEKGVRRASLCTAAKAAKALGISLDGLAAGKIVPVRATSGSAAKKAPQPEKKAESIDLNALFAELNLGVKPEIDESQRIAEDINQKIVFATLRRKG